MISSCKDYQRSAKPIVNNNQGTQIKIVIFVLTLKPLMNAARLHSSGNSFLVSLVDVFDISGSEVAAFCKDREIDGMIMIRKNALPDIYELSFFNNDGSPFKMCFNGSLCASLYLKQLLNAHSFRFFAPHFGNLEARVSEDTISLIFEVPKVKILPRFISQDDLQGTCYSLSLTDNHKVVLTGHNFFKSTSFLSLAKELRAADSVFPEGANVHFIYKNSDTVYIRHYEKGIEKETLSCGSGCVAAAIILSEAKEIEFVSPGGKLLIQKINENEWMLSGKPEFVRKMTTA